jgi:Zn-finger nucleic acid-binding protein
MIKKCSVCKDQVMKEILLDDNLPAYQCENCQGIWISSNPYLSWLKTHGSDIPEKVLANADAPKWDTKELKLCPDCGRIMSRFQILSNPKIYLDRCGNCNCVWLDKGEWNILVERNLHDNINSFFTKPWQDHIRVEETRNVLEKLYLEKFGTTDYARLKEFREWLKENSKRHMMLAYLQADDPYKV